MQLLLKAPEILIDNKDADGVTPLGRAAESGNETAVLLLLEHGASRIITDSRGRRPIDLALAQGKLEVAAIIEADPADVDCSEMCELGRVLPCLSCTIDF